jgi:4-hydroxybutyryl-CoA dehydratase/vinylacetyl-CoA-Delta-isomerase
MKTGKEFVDSLQGLKLQLYVLGERVEEPTLHPILRPSLNALARTYDMAYDPDHGGLFARRGLSGEGINCFTSLHHSTEDLLNKGVAHPGPGDRHLFPALRWLGCPQRTREHDL